MTLTAQLAEHRAQAAAAWHCVTTLVGDVAPEQVQWLWPGRVASGKLTILAGDPGLGKSWLALDIAARVSTGAAWPDRAPGVAPAHVLLLSAEDGLADTIRPRLDALGADVTRITHVGDVQLGTTVRPIDLRDTAALEATISELGVRLLIVDPLTAYLAGTDSHRDADVRGLLAPLAALGERTRAAILAIMHLSKALNRPALYRAGGSIAFNAAARVALGLAADPDREGRRILAPVKTNLTVRPTALAFEIRDGGLIWERDPVVGADADALMNPPPPEERIAWRRAETWLLDQLAGGPVKVKDLRADAAAACHAWRTVERAKQHLDETGPGIAAHQKAVGEPWYWQRRRPDRADESARPARPPQVNVAISAPSPDADGQFTEENAPDRPDRRDRQLFESATVGGLAPTNPDPSRLPLPPGAIRRGRAITF